LQKKKNQKDISKFGEECSLLSLFFEKKLKKYLKNGSYKFEFEKLKII
jgi:hypothetical protein